MKKSFLLIVLGLTIAINSRAQKTYSSSGMEMIFSFANVDMSQDPATTGGSTQNIMRWAPVFNLQSYINFDMSEKMGVFSGFFLRNVGFISDIPQGVVLNDPDGALRDKQNIRYKFRSYNIGIPIGIKLGKMNHSFIYGGYEIAYSFNYKEKRFEDGDKTSKSSFWFGDANKRVEPWQHGFFVGIQFPYGANIKFKYYNNNFFVNDYINVNGEKPYEFFNANVFYFSLSFNVLKNTDFYYYDPNTDYEELSMR